MSPTIIKISAEETGGLPSEPDETVTDLDYTSFSSSLPQKRPRLDFSVPVYTSFPPSNAPCTDESALSEQLQPYTFQFVNTVYG
jgi:hypothetical protein